MPKNDILQSITVDKLIFWGKWLGVASDGRKVIITWGCIPGSVVDVRILKEKKSHYEWQELHVVKRSPIEVPLPAGFQMYGGAKWLTIGYPDQLAIKSEQIREAFHHLRTHTTDTLWHPITPSPEIYGYRNKVEFSWGKYISSREWVHDDFRFGFHAQGQFDRIEDCTYCALADAETNAIFQSVNILSRSSGLPTYDPKTGEGFWRHLVIRKWNTASQIMLVFSVNGIYEWKVKSEKWKEKYGSVISTIGDTLPQNDEQDTWGYLKSQIQDFFTKMVWELTDIYPNIASIYFLENTGRADIVTGNPILIFGSPTISADLLGLTFEIQPKSFFQVNTLGAEKLYSIVGSFCKGAVDGAWGDWGFFSDTKSSAFQAPSLQKKVLLDLYAGTGTIGILLAKYFAQVYSVELVPSASMDGVANAGRNSVKNVEFINKKVEDFARDFAKDGGKADTIILDPPREWLHPSAIPHILSFGAREIIYVSCNPATLARDLEVFVGKISEKEWEETKISPILYTITNIAPMDMFPHTHHIETVVRLEKL